MKYYIKLTEESYKDLCNAVKNTYIVADDRYPGDEEIAKVLEIKSTQCNAFPPTNKLQERLGHNIAFLAKNIIVYPKKGLAIWLRGDNFLGRSRLLGTIEGNNYPLAIKEFPIIGVLDIQL